MEEELKLAAQAGDIDAFYGVLEKEAGILKTIDEKEFVETPLHSAAYAGRTHIAVEILSLKPSFGRKLNSRGHSPLDLALRNSHIVTVKRLIKFDPELVRVRSRERKTPLHYVAETNDIHLLAEFLVACPMAIRELTIRGETALHLAVLKGNIRAFQVIVGWLNRTDNKEILGWKDENGNTVLHIAAHTSQVEVIARLIKERVGLDDKNQDNQTALDIVCSRTASQEDIEIQKMLRKADALETSKLANLVSMADILTSQKHAICRTMARNHVDLDKGVTDDMRNMFLVVTVLIVTATFQAALSPPGGGWQSTNNNVNDGNNNNNNNNGADDDGKFSKDDLYTPFVVVNSLAFSASLALTFLLLPYRRYDNILIGVSLRSLMVGYVISVFLISPPTNWKPGTIISTIIVELVFVGAISSIIIPMGVLIMVLPHTLRRWARIMLSETTSWYRMEKQVRLGKYVTYQGL